MVMSLSRKRQRYRMAFKIFDYQCTNDHITEHMTGSDERTVLCPECGHTSHRIISPVPAHFKGFGWPDKDTKWIKEHERAGANNGK